MRFRIIDHNSKYISQVYDEFSQCWFYVGLSYGYDTIVEAKRECLLYKKEREPHVIEEFIL